ncbi:MAG: hypothetical protein LBE36_13300 [Flavobacteriaceae bacterium]|nr:hypothetical protein [Flavobacteriaceae bacterium]
MNKLVFLIVIIFLISCNSQHKENCIVPRVVVTYIENNLPDSKIIRDNELMPNWKNFISPKMDVACPTMLDYDFTNDGYKDFICMLTIKDNTGDFPYLVAFNNYETSKINHIIIEGIADYGKEYGYGNIIYLAEKGAHYYKDDNIDSDELIYLPKSMNAFYSIKMESSLALIFWNNGKYEIRYIGD